MVESMWKSLRNWLGVALIGGSVLMSREANAGQDALRLDNNFQKNGDLTAQNSTLNLMRYFLAIDGKDPYDTLYSYPAPRIGQWNPKSVTRIEGYDLSADRRSTNSLTDYNFDLSIIIQDGQNVIGTNQLFVQVSTNSIYQNYIPLNEHWIINYDIKTNYYTGGAVRKDKKNVRDLCPVPNVLTNWNSGVGINIPSSATNANGEVVFGTGTLHKEYNKLVSSSNSGGTNNPSGEQILNYGTNKTVSLDANPGCYVDSYVLARTGNTGGVTVTTNNVSPRTNHVDVVLNDIKGSNSVYATYASDTSKLQLIVNSFAGPDSHAIGSPNPTIGTNEYNVSAGGTNLNFSVQQVIEE